MTKTRISAPRRRVLLGNGLLAQGGKDRIYPRARLAHDARDRSASRRRVEQNPDALRESSFHRPCALARRGRHLVVRGRQWGHIRVDARRRHAPSPWRNDNPGTSPVVADGMLFVYDPHGGLRIYEATTGRQISTWQCGAGHRNSPIVADGRIALPEGKANSHGTSGILDIWRLKK